MDGREVGVECVADDINKLTEEDLEKLKLIPGAYEAHQGVKKVNLLVCALVGKKACISKQALAEFQNAPPSVAQKLQTLEKSHANDWEDMLGSLLDESEALADPREDEPLDGIPPVTDLPKFESEAALTSKVEIIARVKCNSDKFLTLLEDSNHCIYGLCADQDHVVKRGTKLGAVGSGKLVPQNLTLEAGVVPFELESDKSWVEVSLSTVDDDETTARVKTGSLYMVAKELVKQTAGQPISIISVGKLISRDSTQSHRHGFDFEHPKGSVDYKPFDYAVKADGASKSDNAKSAGNIFKGLANRNGMAGAVEWMFRFHFNQVTAKLIPTKPFAVTSQDINMVKGVPVKLAWPKQ
jgi:hypothetical protein